MGALTLISRYIIQNTFKDLSYFFYYCSSAEESSLGTAEGRLLFILFFFSTLLLTLLDTLIMDLGTYFFLPTGFLVDKKKFGFVFVSDY